MLVALRLLLCLSLVGGWVNTAHAASVLIVSSERSAGYVEAAEALLTELENGGIARSDVRQVLVSDLLAEEVGSVSKGVVVSLGTEALKQVLARSPRVPVLAALIPRSSYERVLRESEKRGAAQTTALYLDQPWGRQLDLVRLALPDVRQVGVLWGPESVSQQAALSAAMHSRGLGMRSGVATTGAVFGALKAALDEADVFLAVADPQVFNSASLSNILLATYRAHIPMVAFSPSYVKAGALLALHSSPAQIGSQAAGMARTILQGGPTPPAQYPSEFSVSLNEQVARSLGLQINAAALSERLRKMERKP